MGKYHNVVNLTPEFFLQDVEYTKSLRRLNITNTIPNTVFKPEIEDKLKSIGSVKHFSTYIFSKEPNRNQWPIHIDPDYNRAFNTFAFNIILQAQGIMQWYDAPSDKATIGTNTINSSYVYFKEEDCILVEEWTEGKCAFVKIDSPHQVSNNGDIERIAISVRWSRIDKYQNTYEKFKQVFNLV